MTGASNASPRRRSVFLLGTALVITAILYWMVKGFVLALLMAAILAGLLQPLYRRILAKVKGKEVVAAGLTVLTSLVLMILPATIFLGLVVNEAAQIASSASEWFTSHDDGTEELKQKLADDSLIKKYLPDQAVLTEKAGEVASKVGAWVAGEVVAGVKGTASFVLTIFVMLYAMSFFLTEGRNVLRSMFRHTPLTEDDQAKLLGTFVSVARATIKGKLFVGMIQGGLAGISFWLAGIDGAFFWTAVMAVLSVIPAVGTALIWIPAVIFLVINGQTGAAIAVGLWCALVVSTIDNFLNPIFIGKDAEMPDILVLLTTLGGLAVFGIFGMIIGPIIGSLFVSIWRLWGDSVDEARAADRENEQEVESPG
ncbi:MAG: AI-2E family transporter [Akkermansiaceae bacterium]